MLDWIDRMVYCPLCGSATSFAESGYKRHCPNADCKTNQAIHNVSHPRVDPVVIGMVRFVVLLRHGGRGRWPTRAVAPPLDS